MAEISRYWTGRISEGALGDAGPYSAAQFADFVMRILDGAEKANRGVIRAVENELEVTPNSPAGLSVLVESGAAVVQGRWYYNSSNATVNIAANVSGSTRIDIVILEADYTAQTVRLDVVQGTPAAGVPALTQTANTLWQIPLAYLTLASGFATITAAMITDWREYANIPSAVAFDITNVSASILETGSLVIWSGANVTTTTTAGVFNLAGIIERRTLATSGTGRIISFGIVPVICAVSVSAGDLLTSSTAAGQANTMANVAGRQPFGRVLVANTGAGTKALCFVNFLTQQSAQKVAVGTYTGDGNSSQAITGIGFRPDEVWVYKTTVSAPAGIWLRASNIATSILVQGVDGAAVPFSTFYDSDGIISLDSNGFTVGDDTPLGGNVININANSYGYIARG